MARKKPPYPQELRDTVFKMRTEYPDTPISAILDEFFRTNPKYKKFQKRLTPQRAHAMVGLMRREAKKKGGAPAPTAQPVAATSPKTRPNLADLPHDMIYSQILGTASAMKRDGKLPKVILRELQKKYPNIEFPGARVLMQLLFKNSRPSPKRTPVKKYAVEGDGFRVEITYHNPKVREKIMQIVGALID
jgi:hypothetical protein